MIKKLTALIVTVCVSLSSLCYAKSFSDVPDVGEYFEAIDVLSELGILSGMGNNEFNPDGYLTRAQMARIAVSVMGKDKDAVATTSAFSDVKSTDWYSPYVNIVSKEGVITGYPDGSFGADDQVTYAQAITILIRLLGYDGADVGYKWPKGYLDKAEALEITKDISFNADDMIDRKTTALIIYRALFTKMKNSKEKLVAGMDATVYEDTVIQGTRNDSAAILSNQVKTDKGIFTYDESGVNMEKYAGYKGTLVTNDDGKIISFVPDGNLKMTDYTVAAAYNESGTKNVTVLDENGKSVTIGENTSVYYKGEENRASVLTSGIKTGSSVKVFDKNGAISHVFVDEYKHEGPKVVLSTSMVGTMFNYKDKANLKVVRKGFAKSLSDIELYDVLYYSEKTNTIYAYCDRVTGMYEEAYPMKSNVTAVKVSGKEYSLSTLNAINALNESVNAFKIGDRVTLLLGETGDVVDVVSLTETDVSMYGVVTGSGKEISSDDEKEGRTEYYVNVMHADGEEVKYTVADDTYSDKIGKFCSVDFENSYAVLKFPAEVKLTGEVDKDKKTLGGVKFASEYGIVEYSGDEKNHMVSAVTIEELDGVTLSKKNVKHVEKNKKGEIVFLYIESVTGNDGVYGIITKTPDGETGSGSYTILSGKTEYSVTGKYNSYKKGDCVVYKMGEMSHIVQVGEGTKINSYNDNLIEVSGKTYTLSDDVTFYLSSYKSSTKTLSVEDSLKCDGKVVLYSDKALSSGGKIRVVSITDNN